MKNLSAKQECFIKLILLSLIFLFILAEFLLALTPPVSRDALIHHLAIPKLWLVHGGFYETPWAGFSYYPMNLSLLYLVPLYFGNDIIPNFIHLSFGLGTAVLLYSYLNKRCGQFAGLLGALMFISLPTILRTATTAYVDVGLVFFTTLSVLSYVYWRDTEYQSNGWLLVSAIAMGLALGTKYSALPVWFFLTLAIVFVYARETGRQWPALQYGFLFFVISLMVFSPWLIKNAILTGNPLYPLLKSFFGDGGINVEGVYSAMSGDAGGSMFKTRQWFWGESVWETLLIPLRFFLQGQDHNPRYFDGVLNPVLLFIAPFAFINKTLKTEKLLFLCFAAFVILLAFFMDQHRIRYILPAVPFVIILAVLGFVNLFNWMMEKQKPLQKIYLAAFILMVVVMIGFNAVYAKNYFAKIAPMGYILKKESRHQFIARYDGSYPAVRYINEHTRADAKIRLILLAGRGYHLDRPYDDDASFGMEVIRKFVSFSKDEIAFQKYLRSLGCTHLLVRYELMRQFLTDNYSPEEIGRFSEQFSKTVEIPFYDGHYAVFRIKAGS
ncbi:MAG TPA: phospholipid carrier-dependent glycosyltransferase [Smithellaceae bacterium]|jgi:4-amino-4-deoxy-L-arabinose transferase-like glycosyltransferase|nr:phospholipid carrier-dependent glycosyltransferase [Syntrophaceae bacterium]HNY97313.1 phospholipid carrier-dependent glycosyltransferase [Smithellaceae bacterium]HRS96957.1 phospholipid carrier-dependent glycosyltransferase [Smithella sp.]MBP8665576.1 phospholipid carrier-dependent glycosyltransferase [Syntrophaceae bacterium]MBP9531356.1 phospholipid carrier-dependent glycosyltransferase [Syntrophaceae bacterium]